MKKWLKLKNKSHKSASQLSTRVTKTDRVDSVTDAANSKTQPHMHTKLPNKKKKSASIAPQPAVVATNTDQVDNVLNEVHNKTQAHRRTKLPNKKKRSSSIASKHTDRATDTNYADSAFHEVNSNIQKTQRSAPVKYITRAEKKKTGTIVSQAADGATNMASQALEKEPSTSQDGPSWCSHIESTECLNVLTSLCSRSKTTIDEHSDKITQFYADVRHENSEVNTAGTFPFDNKLIQDTDNSGPILFDEETATNQDRLSMCSHFRSEKCWNDLTLPLCSLDNKADTKEKILNHTKKESPNAEQGPHMNQREKELHDQSKGKFLEKANDKFSALIPKKIIGYMQKTKEDDPGSKILSEEEMLILARIVEGAKHTSMESPYPTVLTRRKPYSTSERSSLKEVEEDPNEKENNSVQVADSEVYQTDQQDLCEMIHHFKTENDLRKQYGAAVEISVEELKDSRKVTGKEYQTKEKGEHIAERTGLQVSIISKQAVGRVNPHDQTSFGLIEVLEAEMDEVKIIAEHPVSIDEPQDQIIFDLVEQSEQSQVNELSYRQSSDKAHIEKKQAEVTGTTPRSTEGELEQLCKNAEASLLETLTKVQELRKVNSNIDKIVKRPNARPPTPQRKQTISPRNNSEASLLETLTKVQELRKVNSNIDKIVKRPNVRPTTPQRKQTMSPRNNSVASKSTECMLNKIEHASTFSSGNMFGTATKVMDEINGEEILVFPHEYFIENMHFLDENNKYFNVTLHDTAPPPQLPHKETEMKKTVLKEIEKCPPNPKEKIQINQAEIDSEKIFADDTRNVVATFDREGDGERTPLEICKQPVQDCKQEFVAVHDELPSESFYLLCRNERKQKPRRKSSPVNSTQEGQSDDTSAMSNGGQFFLRSVKCCYFLFLEAVLGFHELCFCLDRVGEFEELRAVGDPNDSDSESQTSSISDGSLSYGYNDDQLDCTVANEAKEKLPSLDENEIMHIAIKLARDEVIEHIKPRVDRDLEEKDTVLKRE